MGGFRYEKDGEKIVTITLDVPAPPAHNEAIFRSVDEVVARLEKDDITGVVLVSGKEPLPVGTGARELMAFPGQNRKDVYERLAFFKNRLRRLESLGKPVVAVISGSSLGLEFEIFLAAHRRIAINNVDLQVGLSEGSGGLFPGFGGLVRLVYLLGLEKALPLLQDGSRLSPEKALEIGLVNELAEDREDLILKAKAWIRANPEASQPWDKKGYQIPGGTPAHPRIAGMIIAAPAILKKKFPAGNPAQDSILSAAVESAQVDFESALRIESRYLVELLFARAMA